MKDEIAHQLFDLNHLPDTTFTLYAENLLDKDVYYPEFAREIINSFPTHTGGRSLFGRISVKF